MNRTDDQLNRLFRAAASSHIYGAPPFGLETRVLAAWRSAASPTSWEQGVLVRGLILAGVIMGVSFWTALAQKGNSDSDYLQLADSTAQTEYP